MKSSRQCNYFCAALTFAHRGLAAAVILARPAALILRLFFAAPAVTDWLKNPKSAQASFLRDLLDILNPMATPADKTADCDSLPMDR